jgi:hypothetical protein
VIAINADTPKNGPRHEIEPSTPPTKGPTAIPKPSDASYRMIAWATDPRAEFTMVASAVAMNKALPRPHSARQPTMLGADPAGDHARDEHRHPHHRHVAGEQQGHLRRCGVEIVGDRLENRLDEADPP